MMIKQEASFKFKDFSKKQKKVMYFWDEHSKFKDYDIIVADGSIRAGKSIAMIVSFLNWSQSTFRNECFIIAGKSMGALKRNVIKPLRQIISAWGWYENYNRSENIIIIGNNTYYLFGANNEASQDVLQGLTAAGALGDEIALFPQSFTDQMIGRCSVDGSKIFFNCNPGNPYNYFKTEYIDKAEEKMIYYLHFTMNDNLTLSEKVKARYMRMFTGVFYKRYILGLWVMSEGVIYDMFTDNHLQSLYLNKYKEFYISCDYGQYNAFALGLFGKTIDGKSCMIKEFYYSGRDEEKQKTDEEYYNDLVVFVAGLKIRSIIIDPSASSFIVKIKKEGHFHVRLANNSVLEGIRNTGTELLMMRLLFDKYRCKVTPKEFYSYIWDKKAAERGEDKPLKQNDHIMDLIKYYINTIIYNGGEAIIFT